MENINKILATLSAEKRALFEKRLLSDPEKYNVYPLSFSQKRLWFLDQLEPGSTTFNIPASIKLTGNLNVKKLSNCINKIVQRHEILRSSILNLANNPFQVIHNDFNIGIDEIDISNLDDIRKNETLKNKIIQNCNTYINLSKFPLFKIILYKLSNTENVLLIIMHHIISDGWSVNIFVNELSKLYTSEIENSDLILSKLDIQYIDFAKWQNEWSKTADFENLLNYWKQYLGKGSPKLKLPYDFNLDENESKANKIIKIISAEKVDVIKKITQENHSTLFMFFASAINILLFKYTSQNDISIGTPVANRNKDSIQKLIGFFVNLIVLKVNIDPKLPFNKFLGNVRQICLDIFDNQEMPFEILVEEIQPERNLQSTPLFNVMYSFTNKSNNKLSLPNLEISKVDIDFNVVQYDLTFNIHENELNEIWINLEYNEGLFKESNINRLLENFIELIEIIVKNPEKEIYKINTLSKIDQLIIDENNKEIESPKFIGVLEQFETIVQKYSSKKALIHKDRFINYSELNNEVNILADYINNRLKINDSFIGVFLENSIEYIISILAILKSGNAFLPIDVNYPIQRINKYIETSRIKNIITVDKYLNRLEKLLINKISIDNKIFTSPSKTVDNIHKDIEANTYAYCIFTSGSTGIPKGVIITHQNLSTFVNAARLLYEVNDQDYILQFASNSFDTSIEEIFSALTNGSTLVIRTEEMLNDAEKFIDIIDKEKITILDLPTSYFSQITHQMVDDKISYPRKLKKIIVGGEKFDKKTFSNWYKSFNNQVDLYNGYGPTEITVIATAWKYNANSKIQIGNEVPIGKALQGYSALILDELFNPVPVGSVGELYIGGNAVAVGYQNDPKTTCCKFLPNPFSKISGSRMYRTGDLVKLLEDGNIEYVGRIDNQVKVRGFRIELEEIERVLKNFRKIKDCKIVIDKVSAYDHKINAYLLSNENLKNNIAEIKKYAKEKLPKYMLPSKYFQIKKIPLSINGKVDTNQLLENKNELYIEEKNDVPLTQTQERLLNILKDLLKAEKLSLSDNFFELGGHSLLATHLTALIRKEFNLDFPVKFIFEAVDLHDISEHIQNLEIKKVHRSVIPVSESRDNFPLSFGQQRLWFLDKVEPESPFYNIPFAIRIKGSFNFDIFLSSINKVVERHDILRTTFEIVEGKPIQKIHESLKVNLIVHDISKFEKNKKEEAINKYCDEEMNKGFLLEKLPLFRICCIIVNNNEFVVVTNIHHIIADGWSSNILIKEIVLFYNSEFNNKKIDLSEITIQYGDYSKWQREWLSGTELKKRIKFWKDYLNEYPKIFNLPLDYKRPPIQTYNGAIEQIKIDGKITQQLLEINKKEKITHFMFFLSVFYILLYRLSNQEEILVGTPVANRENPEIQNLIGLFVNTVVIGGNLEGDPKFMDFLKRIKNSSINAFENKELPFEKILDAVNLERNAAYSPLFQVMFTFNHFEKAENIIGDLIIQDYDFESKTSKFDLSLTVQETENQEYLCGIEYNTDLFKKSTIQQWLEYYEFLINEIIVNPNNKILDYRFPFRKQNFIEDTINFEPVDFIERLNEHAKTKRESTALIYNEIELNYFELDFYSTELAKYLLSENVNKGELVGIFLDRSIESILSLISLLKINAAFIPLDTKYPTERLEYILRDSKIKRVICSTDNKNKIPTDIQKIEFNNYQLHNANKEKSKNLNYFFNPDLPAYLIYTSGTTGKPKSVLVSYSNLNSFINAASLDYNISEADSLLQFASLSFDTCLEEIFPILFKGGKLVLRNDEMISDNELFLKAISKEKITKLDLPTAYWHQLSNEMLAKNLEFHKELDTIIIGGEKASKQIYSKWFERFGNKINLINTYGPTETTVVAALWSSQNHNEEYFNELPIGKNLSNSNIFVLDANLNCLPIGIVGELYVGGENVVIGYLNDCYQTAEKFIPNPFSNKQGSRLYKTGDFVRLLSSGNIEFIGRNDHQIKIRGFRVELSEIEKTINSFEFVKESVVVKLKENNKDKLVCYYVSNITNNLSYDRFASALRGKLPEFMIPNNFVSINKIPLTISGKVNRKALEQKKISIDKIDRKVVSPKTEKEIILFKIWKEVLGENEFGVTDNFFELGGDSIIGIQIISKARQEGVHIKPIDLFQYQTIRELVSISLETQIVNAEQGIVHGSFPAIPIQRMFLLSEFYNPNHWNQSILFKIDQELNIENLEKTITILLEHHDALRIRDKSLDKQNLEIIKEIDTNSFEMFDLSNENNKSHKVEIICEQLQKSLNIKNGPLFKVAYFKLGNKESRILIVVHHLAIDGISWRILLEDFQNIFTTLNLSKELILPSKTSSYINWALQLKKYSNSEKLKNEFEYWKNIAINYENPFSIEGEKENLEKTSENINLVFDEELTTNLLKNVNSKFNTKITEVLLTALIRSYSIWQGKRKLLVFLESHGRENDFENMDISRTVGWFTTIYPVLLDLKKSINIEEAIITIKEQLRTIPQEGIGYGILRYLSDNNEFQNTLRVFDSVGLTFNYLGKFDNIVNKNSLFKISEENKGYDRDQNNKRDSVIDITSNISANKLRFNFNYSNDVCTRDYLIEWTDLFKKTLEEIVEYCLKVNDNILTTSDFNLVDLDSKKLNKIFGKLKKK